MPRLQDHPAERLEIVDDEAINVDPDHDVDLLRAELQAVQVRLRRRRLNHCWTSARRSLEEIPLEVLDERHDVVAKKLTPVPAV